MFKKLFNKSVSLYAKAGMTASAMLPMLANAADVNPWNNGGTTVQNGDVAGAIGTQAETDIKWVLIILGGLLCVGGIIGIINLLFKDAKEREHSNMVLTIVLIGLAITAGIGLITYAWTGLSGNGP